MLRFQASYQIEMPLDISPAAESMAGEKFSGTFLRIEGETQASRDRHTARVNKNQVLESVSRFSLTHALHGAVNVTLSWLLNIGYLLPDLLTTVLRNLTELRLSGLCLLGIRFPVLLPRTTQAN